MRILTGAAAARVASGPSRGSARGRGRGAHPAGAAAGEERPLARPTDQAAAVR